MAKEIPIASYETEEEAGMWADLLRRDGIPSVVTFIGPSQGSWLQPVLTGSLELRVLESDADRARQLLQDTGDRREKKRVR